MDLSLPLGDLSVLERSIVEAIVGGGDEGGDEEGRVGWEVEGGEGGGREGGEGGEGGVGGAVSEDDLRGREGKAFHHPNIDSNYANNDDNKNPRDSFAPKRHHSTVSSGRRQLLNFITPSACAEFAARKRNRKKNDEDFSVNDDEDGDNEGNEGERERQEEEERERETKEKVVLLEDEKKKIVENIRNKRDGKENKAVIEKTQIRGTETIFTEKASMAFSNNGNPEIKEKNDKKINSNNSSLGVKKKRGNEEVDSSMDIEEIMGFSGFKKSYRN